MLPPRMHLRDVSPSIKVSPRVCVFRACVVAPVASQTTASTTMPGESTVARLRGALGYPGSKGQRDEVRQAEDDLE